MTYPSPLAKLHRDRNALVMPYGPEDAGIELVESFGALELEYAALRKHAVLLDTPHRATIEVTGDDAADFLNNMLTKNVADLKPGGCASSFWLNRKGRIDADLRVVRLGEKYLFDVDAFAASRLCETLGGYIITEEVELTDITARTHRFALHGPGVARALAHVIGTPIDIDENRAIAIDTPIGRLTVDRHDSAGVPGLELFVAAADAETWWSAFAELAPRDVGGDDDGFKEQGDRPIVRPGGFHAWNIARIEAGTPVYNLDFGPDSLPGETGVLRERVDFDKGCYLGQEIVARMDALGHPKRILCALAFESIPADPNHPEIGPLQPVTGSMVSTVASEDDASGDATAGSAGGQAVGGVTSSTLSPLLGRRPVAFAMMKWGSHEPGTNITAEASGLSVPGIVRETLRFVEFAD